MRPGRRRRIEEIFEALIEMSREDRDEALAKASGGDTELMKEVKKLLLAHDRSEGLLEGEPPFRRWESRSGGVAGKEEVIGRYRILREIGKGGMGTVYLAERADGHFEQRVALKLISRADETLRARIVAERQILASLQHPNIARLLDGGVTNDGRPFLVMEYVSGLPIDVYCDRMRLSLRERLKVFLTVLGALEHAHRNLVVHRDLKPSNILVLPSGDVKLLDFGIAKLLNPTLAGDDVPVTRFDQRALTPEYASPEQIRGEAITTASDVFSLGVVLYELLSGYRPFCIPENSLPAIVKTVCEDDPPRPSVRVQGSGHKETGTDGESLEERKAVAATRYTTSARHPRSLKGDLDAIVMKALRKEPVRRYTSVELFAQDIRHYLDGLPIMARRGTTGYKLRKFARRHRAGVLAGVTVALSLLAGAAMVAWQAGVAADERDRARAALRESEEVTEFLLSLFETSDPLETPGDTVTVLDLLSRGMRRADSLAGEPLVRARLLQVMAKANGNLGRYGEARELAGEAVSLLEREYGEGHHDLAGALGALGVALSASGQYDSARTVLTRAVQYEQTWHHSEVLEMADLLEALARVTIYLGDLSEAEELAERALQIKVRFLGEGDTSTLNTLGALASVYRFQGRYDRSEAVFREVLARRRAIPDPDITMLTADMLQVGDLLRLRGHELDEAESLIREAVALLQDGGGMSNPNFVWGLTSLSLLQEELGNLEEAETLLAQALEVRRRTFGEDHPLVVESMGEYGSFLNRNGRPREAESLFRAAVETDLRTVGPTHSRHAGTLSGLAAALTSQGLFTEADSLMDRAIWIRAEAQGRRTPVVAQELAARADLNTQMGRYVQAESYLAEALDIVTEQSVGGIVPSQIHGAFVRLYEAWDKPEKAAQHRALAVQGE
ncbi:MAG: serine/threonine-protein kinase [Gemmatimonadota bacterium]|jgi:serine/threonine-protein kinase